MRRATAIGTLKSQIRPKSDAQGGGPVDLKASKTDSVARLFWRAQIESFRPPLGKWRTLQGRLLKGGGLPLRVGRVRTRWIQLLRVTRAAKRQGAGVMGEGSLFCGGQALSSSPVSSWEPA